MHRLSTSILVKTNNLGLASRQTERSLTSLFGFLEHDCPRFSTGIAESAVYILHLARQHPRCGSARQIASHLNTHGVPAATITLYCTAVVPLTLGHAGQTCLTGDRAATSRFPCSPPAGCLSLSRCGRVDRMELCTGWVPQSRGAGACHESTSPYTTRRAGHHRAQLFTIRPPPPEGGPISVPSLAALCSVYSVTFLVGGPRRQRRARKTCLSLTPTSPRRARS